MNGRAQRRRGIGQYFLAVAGTLIIWRIIPDVSDSGGVLRTVIAVLPPLLAASLVVLRMGSRGAAESRSGSARLFLIAMEALALAVMVGLGAAGANGILFGDYLPV